MLHQRRYVRVSTGMKEICMTPEQVLNDVQQLMQMMLDEKPNPKYDQQQQKCFETAQFVTKLYMDKIKKWSDPAYDPDKPQ